MMGWGFFATAVVVTCFICANTDLTLLNTDHIFLRCRKEHCGNTENHTQFNPNSNST